MRGRKLAQEYIAFYRKYVPGCENMEHVTTGSLLGVRESRRIVGEYELTFDDYLARRQFPDQIAVFNKAVDIHVYDDSEAEYQRYYKEYHQDRPPEAGRVLRHSLRHPRAPGLAESVGGRAMQLERRAGPRLDPRAAGRVDDGPGRRHGRRAVDRHRPAGLRTRHGRARRDAAPQAGRICRKRRSAGR